MTFQHFNLDGETLLVETRDLDPEKISGIEKLLKPSGRYEFMLPGISFCITIGVNELGAVIGINREGTTIAASFCCFEEVHFGYILDMAEAFAEGIPCKVDFCPELPQFIYSVAADLSLLSPSEKELADSIPRYVYNFLSREMPGQDHSPD